MKVTATAWLSKHSYLSAEQLLTATGKQLVEDISFTELDMSTQGYTKVGTATIEFDLIDRKAMIDNKIVSLRAELQGVKAQAQVKVQKLEDQLQSLLAIEVSK
jgi:hypothetical protein